MATRKPTTGAIKAKLEAAFKSHLGVDRLTAGQLLASATLQDKAYELHALIAVMRELKNARPFLSFTLVHGTSVTFRAKGGPIDRTNWPYIRIDEHGSPVGELWVDIECLAISADSGAKALTGHLYGKCHELDIVLVMPETDGRPDPYEILLGVEAKDRPFTKALLKELLGVRREMTMHWKEEAYPNPYWFVWWSPSLPAMPPSGLVAYCSSDTINKYAAPADFWGIKMEYLPL
ncbi:hypothetical protein SZ64_00645 [Erythrobacter sp. SG61-1L]|uniref:hypothetical protein n=1 Tax=Erythrobacter sp. SG61-1L TaxID=1603897 RepID=UPI0006C925A4|nr:hypothetical protein [Erythrobacter sp. SG61-1L]KPL66739.1 hypothetical protein SZ64_00645 [Erythrobacter sp. SG61-1L]